MPHGSHAIQMFAFSNSEPHYIKADYDEPLYLFLPEQLSDITILYKCG